MSNENGETNVPEETSGQTIGSDDSPDVATNLLDDPSWRLFFKRAAVAGGTVLLGGAGAYGAAMRSLDGRP